MMIEKTIIKTFNGRLYPEGIEPLYVPQEGAKVLSLTAWCFLKNIRPPGVRTFGKYPHLPAPFPELKIDKDAQSLENIQRVELETSNFEWEHFGNEHKYSKNSPKK